MSIWQCLKHYTSPNIEYHMHIENVIERGIVLMYINNKHLDFILPSCCMNISFLQPQRPQCVYDQNTYQNESMPCIAYKLVSRCVLFIHLKKIYVYMKWDADLAKKSFHYHPTYAAYKDNRNGVIYLYMCNFKNDINLAYDWLKLS